MSTPRKHHYLPQFYLRGFSEDGRSVFQMEKSTGRAYNCSVGDAAAIRDFHLLDNAETEDPHRLEKGLSDVEAKLSVALAEAIKSGITSYRHYETLVFFLSLMRCRVPAFKAFIDRFHQDVVRSTLTIMDNRGALPPRPKSLEHLLKIEDLEIDIANWKLMEFMFNLASHPKTLGMLISMRPAILRAPADAYFFTSDQPVALYHPGASLSDPYGVGLLNRYTEVSFPLSNKALLRLTRPGGAPEERVLPSYMVDEFNRRTIIMAESLVFAPARSPAAIDAVSQYRAFRAGMDVETRDRGENRFLTLTRFRPVLEPSQYRMQPEGG